MALLVVVAPYAIVAMKPALSSLATALPVAAAAVSGTFDILSMNVAGLPPLFNGNDVPGDKATNARQIGTYFSQYGYDLINVQEVSFPID